MDLQNFFLQSLPLHSSCLVFIPSNAHVMDDIEQPHGLWSPTFVVDDIIGSYLHS